MEAPLQIRLQCNFGLCYFPLVPRQPASAGSTCTLPLLRECGWRSSAVSETEDGRSERAKPARPSGSDGLQCTFDPVESLELLSEHLGMVRLCFAFASPFPRLHA